MWLVLHSLTLQPTTVRRTIRFPRDSLIGGQIVPGVRLDSSPFEAGGSSWQVSLYPCGVSASDANRVGVYLKLNGASGREVDASFSLALQVLPVDRGLQGSAPLAAAAVSLEGAESRGLEFRCGMTFCSAAEALESAGRCEDWGAHVYNSALLFSELESTAESTAAVDVELQIWSERACGRASEAFLEQTRRLPRGSVRVGEVIVALAGSPARVDDGAYRCVPGVEYRVMRLVAPDGTARFELDNADRSSLVYLLPTSKAARREDDASGSEDGVASVLLDDDTTGSSLPGARFLRRRSRAAPKTTWGETTQDWQGVASNKWPVGVRVDALPPLASRLGFRSFPARFAYAARTSGSVLLLLMVIGASPLWGGYLVTRLGSGYVIPSRSMESTLLVGDVVLAGKRGSANTNPDADR